MSWEDDDKGPVEKLGALYERMMAQQRAESQNTRHGLVFDVPGDELAMQLSNRATEAKAIGDSESARLLETMARYVNPKATYIITSYDLQVVAGVVPHHPAPAMQIPPLRDLEEEWSREKKDS